MSFIRHHNRSALTVLALAGTMIMMQEASAENMGSAAAGAGAAGAADAARNAGNAAFEAGRNAAAARIDRRGAEGPSAERGGGGIDIDAVLKGEMDKANVEQRRKAQKKEKTLMLEKELVLAKQRTNQAYEDYVYGAGKGDIFSPQFKVYAAKNALKVELERRINRLR